MLVYEELQPIGRDDAERLIHSPVAQVRARAVLRASISRLPSDWIETRCLRLLRDANDDVCRAAITAIGHLARLQGLTNHKLALKDLKFVAETRPGLCGSVDDALSDISIFAVRRQSKNAQDSSMQGK